MSRTRGAAMIADRERENDELPIGPGEDVIVAEQGPMELPPLPIPAIYACNPTTLDRNMEASELAEILAMVLGGWSLELPAEKWSALRPDVRRHFKRTA